MLSPSQIFIEPEIMEMVGIGMTLSVTVVKFLQPSAEVPVTVYTVVVPGLALTVLPVVALSPVAGSHE